MNIISHSMGISRQIILIVLLVIVLITSGISIVIAVSSFNNLASITLNELERMSKIFSSQIVELQENAARSVTEMESNPLLSEQLEQLTNLGPYYFNDASLVGRAVEESDKIYAFKAQMEIVKILKPLKSSNKISSISLYSLSPFNLIPDAKPVLNMRMDATGIWVGQFNIKGEGNKRSYYFNSNQNFKSPEASLFDISSIYKLTIQDFHASTQFEPLATRGFDEFVLIDSVKSINQKDITNSKLIIQNGLPYIRTSAILRSLVSNPESWEAEKVPSMLVVMDQVLGVDRLALIKRQLGIDVALAVDNKIIVSSLGRHEQLSELKPDKTVEASTQSFYYAMQSIFFDPEAKRIGQTKNGIQSVVLSPISILADLTQALFMQMTMLALLAMLVASVAIYWAIRRFVNHPLNQLMAGVEKISAGELKHKVKVSSKNELGQLAIAFNGMSFELDKKTDQLQKYADSLESSNVELKRYQTTLEEMVEMRTSKLKSAQKQLIESEKMASLGELVAGVAHEINTPVGVGVTAASFLQDETNSINKKYLESKMTKEDFDGFLACSLQTTAMILSNLQRATELVQSFKQVAVDQTAEDRRRFQVIPYIEEVLVTLHPRLKKTLHTIEVNGDNIIEVDSYPGAFSQIITNLVMNSVIHAFTDGEAGKITIDLKCDDKQMILTYTDNGCGVESKNLDKIFAPFFTTKRGYGGTGLGMHIVYNLITQKLKGVIECHSELGEGVTFTLTIPLVTND